MEDLAAVIAATGGAAFVYGHSSGAVLAVEAAARSEAIAALTVYEPPYVVGDDRARTVDLRDRVAALLEAGRRDDAMETFFVEGPQAPAEVVAAMKPTPAWQEMAELAHTLPYDLALVGDQVIPVERLATIGIPTLVLSGADSPLWARNAVTAVAAAIPGARRRVAGRPDARGLARCARAGAPRGLRRLTPSRRGPPRSAGQPWKGCVVRGASGSCSSSDCRYLTHPRMNTGHSGTVGTGSVRSGEPPQVGVVPAEVVPRGVAVRSDGVAQATHLVDERVP